MACMVPSKAVEMNLPSVAVLGQPPNDTALEFLYTKIMLDGEDMASRFERCNAAVSYAVDADTTLPSVTRVPRQVLIEAAHARVRNIALYNCTSLAELQQALWFERIKHSTADGPLSHNRQLQSRRAFFWMREILGHFGMANITGTRSANGEAAASRPTDARIEETAMRHLKQEWSELVHCVVHDALLTPSGEELDAHGEALAREWLRAMHDTFGRRTRGNPNYKRPLPAPRTSPPAAAPRRASSGDHGLFADPSPRSLNLGVAAPAPAAFPPAAPQASFGYSAMPVGGMSPPYPPMMMPPWQFPSWGTPPGLWGAPPLGPPGFAYMMAPAAAAAAGYAPGSFSPYDQVSLAATPPGWALGGPQPSSPAAQPASPPQPSMPIRRQKRSRPEETAAEASPTAAKRVRLEPSASLGGAVRWGDLTGAFRGASAALAARPWANTLHLRPSAGGGEGDEEGGKPVEGWGGGGGDVMGEPAPVVVESKKGRIQPQEAPQGYALPAPPGA